ncbi:hypothetical protein R3W88_017497 [Solanum pinnatisectum]|uniref:Uncharacterized protein n=1 Tax=Solanum pinnatisectum TaxID=50273 RepID=A0AAV9L0T7_9SOLN|nr:hypothetical protein R3W88_017497 [Solanum pinnatisectum]
MIFWYFILPEASMRSNNWLPPSWTIVALVVLEILCIWVLYILFFLLLKALWVQLDISGEFHSGVFLLTVMNLLRRLAEEGQRQVNGEPQQNPAPASFCSSPNDSSDVSSCASSNVSSSEKNVAEYSSPSIPDKTK